MKTKLTKNFKLSFPAKKIALGSWYKGRAPLKSECGFERLD